MRRSQPEKTAQSHGPAKQKVESRKQKSRSQATQCDIKATSKRVDSQGIGTLKPPQSHLNATLKPPQSHPKATSKPPQSHLKATLKPPGTERGVRSAGCGMADLGKAGRRRQNAERRGKATQRQETEGFELWISAFGGQSRGLALGVIPACAGCGIAQKKFINCQSTHSAAYRAVLMLSGGN